MKIENENRKRNNRFDSGFNDTIADIDDIPKSKLCNPD